MRDNDLRRLDRLAVMVPHSDLALGVGSQRLFGAGVARLRDPTQDLVSVIERRRHEFGCFSAGVAEHDALVACALVLVAGRVDALGDVGGLGVQQHFDVSVAPMKAVLLVADVLDRLANGCIDLVVRNFGAAGLTRDDHPVGGGQGLAGDADLIGIDARLRPFAEEQIDDFIRNPIANLVRVPFGHGFTGELVILTSHIHDSPAGAPAATTIVRPHGCLWARRRRFCQRAFDASSRFWSDRSLYRTDEPLPSSSADASEMTRSTIRRRTLGSRTRRKARLSCRPSVEARKSTT